MRKQVVGLGRQEQGRGAADFITSQGNKLLLTAAAEAQAKTGHDFMPFFQWDVQHYADQLEPVDDVIKYLIGQVRGRMTRSSSTSRRQKDNWVAVPSGTDHRQPDLLRTDHRC